MSGEPPFSPDQIEAIFFDLDGTLMDTDDQSVGYWEQRLIAARLRREHANRIARYLITALESPLNFTLTALDFVGLDGMLIRLINRLQGHKRQSQFPPIDGARTLIESLSARYRLAIVSTRSKAEASTFLTQTGIDGNLEAIVGRDSTWRIKPHPQPLLSAARLLGVPIERCLMVGDTTVDMRAARRAGAWAVGVLCGFGQRPELERAGAHVILEHTRQLTDLL